MLTYTSKTTTKTLTLSSKAKLKINMLYTTEKVLATTYIHAISVQSLYYYKFYKLR